MLWQLLDHDQIVGRPVNGVFTFQHNLPFNPANLFTYPSRFQILLGQVYYDFGDRRTNWYVQDKWQVNRNLTLNLGVRHDYQTYTPNTKDALAPRLGFALDPTASGRTVIRGGIGKFYEYHLAAVRSNTLRLGPLSPSFPFDTGEDLSADRGVIPTHVCLQPTGSGGLANISPACRALSGRSTESGECRRVPERRAVLDGDRRLGYLWSWSVGVQRELFSDLSVAVDYVGNRGYDNTGLIDINDCGDGANGRVIRCGVDRFDPSGTLIPAAARAANFSRVLQYQTRDDFNSDFESLELSLVKRTRRAGAAACRTRWLGRATSTGQRRSPPPAPTRTTSVLQRCQPARGLCAFELRQPPRARGERQRQSVAWTRGRRGLPLLPGLSDHRDCRHRRQRRPRQLRAARAGRPRRNEADRLAGRQQWPGHPQRDRRRESHDPGCAPSIVFDLPRNQTAGFFWEAHNATNRINYANPTGNRRSGNFLVPTVAGDMARMQLGVRYTF